MLYELITFAKMPYAGLSNMVRADIIVMRFPDAHRRLQEVVERVTDDYRLPQPKGEIGHALRKPSADCPSPSYSTTDPTPMCRVP